MCMCVFEREKRAKDGQHQVNLHSPERALFAVAMTPTDPNLSAHCLLAEVSTVSLAGVSKITVLVSTSYDSTICKHFLYILLWLPTMMFVVL